MKILDRLPIYDEPSLIDVSGEMIQVHRNQVIVWVSLALKPFPAILDTGHSHNFSIARRHLERWGGAELEQIGQSRVSGKLVPQYATGLRLHRNVPGKRTLRDSYPLEMDGGIAVIPDDLPICPRLPPLGIKAIIGNELRLVIDGKRRQVTLKKGWP
jgi:hypothetical protein